MQPGANITTLGEVTDVAGHNRLLLRFVEFSLPVPVRGAYRLSIRLRRAIELGHAKGIDFHSVVWEVRAADAWAEKVIITRKDFERGARRRWVSDLHSIDPGTGTAIVKVGEEQPQDARDVVHTEYTWREWDLVSNRQVRVVGVYAAPEAGLTAYWIKPPFADGPLGFGITAWSLDDALAIMRAFDYGRYLPDDPAGLRVIEGVTIAELDQSLVVAHMGPVGVRGVWYPFGPFGPFKPRLA